MSVPREYTVEECRAILIDHLRAVAYYWAGVTDPEYGDPKRRLEGMLHSVLCVFDGVSGGMPAFDISPSPHPDDKAFCQSEGANWWPSGVVINDCHLHDLLYK